VTHTAISPRALVEALIRADGSAPLGQIYDVGRLLGLDDQRVRLTVRRMIAEGNYLQHGRGRQGTLQQTTGRVRSERQDESFVRFAYAQDAGQADWDGNWHLLSFSIPEKQRAARDALRVAALRFGGAAVHAGLYVSAHQWEPLLEPDIDRLGVGDSVLFATTRDLRTATISDPVVLAARFWPLPALARGYQELSDRCDELGARLTLLTESAESHESTVELLSIALRLAAAFDAALRDDPLLPPELLPPTWPAPLARARFRELWGRIHSALERHEISLFAGYVFS